MIIVRFGSGNEVSKPDGHYLTVGDILADRGLLGVLGASQNVDAMVDGLQVSNDYPIQSGDVVSLQTRANVKG